jgi:hypothetical protein
VSRFEYADAETRSWAFLRNAEPFPATLAASVVRMRRIRRAIVVGSVHLPDAGCLRRR